MNKMLNEQRGVTFLGWCTILAIIGYFVLFTLRLFPLYNEKMIVNSAMESIASRPGVEKMSDADVLKNFLRTVQIGGASRFDDTSIKQLGKIEKSKGGSPRKLTIIFEIRNKFFQDIDLVLNYNKSVELTGKPSGG